MSTVLFTSNRSLDRAENIKTVYDAFKGDKEFIQTTPKSKLPDSKYSLLVTDELVNASPSACLFIGHGMGAGKKYGLDQPNPYFHSPQLITYAIASSECMVTIVSNQCGIPQKKVLPIGMPRTDMYFGYERPNSTYKIYLYAPTFHEGNAYGIDWEYLDTHLNDNEILIVKPHPITKKILHRDYEHIFEYSANRTTTPFLLRADVVITDYSSIMFDAYVANTPVVLFEKNLDSYMKKRGMYFSYPNMYSPLHCNTEENLLETIRRTTWDTKFNQLRKFYTGACDGHSTERVIGVINEIINSSTNF